METVASIADKFPKFERQREDLSLTRDDEYAFYDGKLKSSVAGVIDLHDYEQFIHEKCVEHSTSKHVYNTGESLAVGALSRFNNNHDKLNARGQVGRQGAGPEGPVLQPLCQQLRPDRRDRPLLRRGASSCSTRLLTMDLSEATLAPNVRPKAGRGIGLTEVPRGTLVHDYTYDENGICTKANCVIPTGMNLGNIDRDMQKYVPEVIAKRTPGADRPRPGDARAGLRPVHQLLRAPAEGAVGLEISDFGIRICLGVIARSSSRCRSVQCCHRGAGPPSRRSSRRR